MTHLFYYHLLNDFRVISSDRRMAGSHGRPIKGKLVTKKIISGLIFQLNKVSDFAKGSGEREEPLKPMLKRSVG